MSHWHKSWYALVGPLMIWVVFIVVAPTLIAVGILNTAELPDIAERVIKTIWGVCLLLLSPLAALAEIAPPFVTREEMNWRNRNRDRLFDADISWEDTPFLPPVLRRIRWVRGSRKLDDLPDVSVDQSLTKPADR